MLGDCQDLFLFLFILSVGLHVTITTPTHIFIILNPSSPTKFEVREFTVIAERFVIPIPLDI